MKIIRKTISALLLAGIGITSIQAQNNSPQAWTLRQCIDYAIEHNIEIRQSTNSVEANKEIGNNLKLGTNIDVFDKSIGANLEKTYNNGSVKIKGGIEYEPLDNAAKMSLNYSAPNNSIYGSAYLNKENPGVNAGYYNKINKHSSLGASVSIFKDDAAFNANYKKTFKDNTNLTMGVYGSTRNKEIGVTARIGF